MKDKLEELWTKDEKDKKQRSFLLDIGVEIAMVRYERSYLEKGHDASVVLPKIGYHGIVNAWMGRPATGKPFKKVNTNRVMWMSRVKASMSRHASNSKPCFFDQLKTHAWGDEFLLCFTIAIDRMLYAKSPGGLYFSSIAFLRMSYSVVPLLS